MRLPNAPLKLKIHAYPHVSYLSKPGTLSKYKKNARVGSCPSRPMQIVIRQLRNDKLQQACRLCHVRQKRTEH